MRNLTRSESSNVQTFQVGELDRESMSYVCSQRVIERADVPGREIRIGLNPVCNARSESSNVQTFQVDRGLRNRRRRRLAASHRTCRRSRICRARARSLASCSRLAASHRTCRRSRGSHFREPHGIRDLLAASHRTCRRSRGDRARARDCGASRLAASHRTCTPRVTSL